MNLAAAASIRKNAVRLQSYRPAKPEDFRGSITFAKRNREGA